MTARAVFDAAAQLAARGRYEAAARLLQQCDPEKLGSPVADLLARIAAQQGDFAGAIAAWEQVLARDAENDAAKRGRARAERMAGTRGAALRLRANLFVALFGLGVLAVGLVGLSARVRGDGGATAGGTIDRDVAESALAATADTIAIGPRADAETTETHLDPKDFRAPGVSVHADGGAVKLTFDDGMFRSGGTRIREGTQRTLTDLGRRLGGLSDRVHVTIIGASDDVPLRAGAAWLDNAALSLARASAVVHYLRMTAGLPADLFSVQGLGVEGAPFPEAQSADRARNRTVVVRIAPR